MAGPQHFRADAHRRQGLNCSQAEARTLSREARLTLGTTLFAFIAAITVLPLESHWRPRGTPPHLH